MSDELIQLEVVTPERTVLKEQVASIILPGERGLFGVMRNHAPLVAVLTIGQVVYRRQIGGEKKRFAISGGFFEIKDNKATILADAAELPEEIDVERARRALQRARERRVQREDIDLLRAELALRRAINRLKVAGADEYAEAK